MLGFIDHNIVQYVKLLIYYIVKLDTYILLGIILFYIPHVVVEGGFHFSIDFIESMTFTASMLMIMHNGDRIF